MSKETMLVYVMAGCAGLQGAVFLRLAISARSRSSPDDALQNTDAVSDRSRIERADDNRERISPQARYAASAVGFVMAGLLLAHLITPAVAYAFLCLAMVGRCVADQILEEQTPRRRSALIGRPRSIDPVLLTWIAVTAAAGLALVPWLFEDANRIAAAVVTMCVAIMVAVIWRVASAPPLLFGNDLAAEQVVDRETRALRTGNASFLTLCAVGIFVAFAGGQQGYINHHYEIWVLQLLSFAILAWSRFYARRLTRTPLTP
jgi:hypothetical protein